jgi:hypothetical protein
LYKPYVTALADGERASVAHLPAHRPEGIRKATVSNAADRLLNALRKARLIAYRGLDIVSGRAIAVRQ